MKTNELRTLLFYLAKWTRKNQEKIKHKVRAKHFLEDMSYILHWLDDERINNKVQVWRNQSVIEIINRLYGLKKLQGDKE